ncbi:MAG: inositol monophosphatase family protein [Pseudomonadota bacterium]|nr:inositol monophosphatase family protein [Pseudomonadota bacterium]
MDKNLVNGFLDRVRAAGGIIREQWADEKRIAFKGRIDLVTQTDLAVEACLLRALPELLPGSAVLAEESHTTLTPDGLSWIVDPVDGTTNYAHGLPMTAVSVALWRDGRAELGAVYAPMLDELFWAVRGGGAFLNGRPIGVSAETEMCKALIATGFPYSVCEEADEICSRLRRVLKASQGVRRFGSAAIDLAYTACGRFEGFYETSLKPWDTAAGWLLVEEAGGRVSGADGKDYDFSGHMIVASNGHVHEALLELLRLD